MRYRLLGLLLSLFALSPVQAANPLVEIKTTLGSIIVELYPDKAPKTVANFLEYLNSGHYNGTVFHRTIGKFVIQGGGFTPALEYKPTRDPVENEAANGLRNEPGTIAMARAYEPHSATAQFFINLTDNKFLNHLRPQPDYYGYCVFGKIVRGLDVAKQIGESPTAAAAHFEADVPVQPVVIEQMALLPAIAVEETRVAQAKPAPKKNRKSVKKTKERKHG